MVYAAEEDSVESWNDIVESYVLPFDDAAAKQDKQDEHDDAALLERGKERGLEREGAAQVDQEQHEGMDLNPRGVGSVGRERGKRGEGWSGLSQLQIIAERLSTYNLTSMIYVIFY